MVWIDIVNEQEDLDYQPDIFFDSTNPEDLLIAKESPEFAFGHFNETEIAYLTGEVGLSEAAKSSVINCEAFRR